MKDILSGTVAAFTLKVLAAGLVFGFNVLIARFFGAEGAGLYYLTLSVVTLGVVIGRFGLDIALLRFAAAAAARKDWAVVRGVSKRGISTSLIISVFVSLVTLLAAPLIAHYLFHDDRLVSLIRWMSLAIVPMVLTFIFGQLLRSLQLIQKSHFIQNVCVPAIGIIVLLLIRRRWAVQGATVAYVAGAGISALIGYWLWRRAVPRGDEISSSVKISELISVGTPLFCIAGVNLISNWASIFLLGIFGHKSDVGVFSVAMRTAMLTSFILQAVGSIAAPKFAALYYQGDIRSLETIAKKSTRLMIVAAMPIAILFTLFPQWIMGFFGIQFSAGGYLLSIMTIGQLVNVATGNVILLLMMSGKEIIARNNNAMGAFINVLLCLALIPFFGPLGGAIAVTVAVAIQNIAAFFAVKRSLGITAI